MRIKQTRIIVAILAFIAALVMSPVASASSFYFTGSGTWDQGTPTTPYSAAGATWQFSLILPDTLSNNPTTQVTDFCYLLNGTTVTTFLPGGVLFYPVADGGGFDLYPTINNTSDVGVISLLFPNDVGSNLNIAGGIFQHRRRWSHSWLRFRDCDHYLYCSYTRTAQHHLAGDSVPAWCRLDPFPSLALADPDKCR
jgi:hypothetical protein